MHATAMLVRHAGAVADENLPKGHRRLGHGLYSHSAAWLIAAARSARFFAKAKVAARTQAPSPCALRARAMRWRLQGPSPARARLNSLQSTSPGCQGPLAGSKGRSRRG